MFPGSGQVDGREPDRGGSWDPWSGVMGKAVERARPSRPRALQGDHARGFVLVSQRPWGDSGRRLGGERVCPVPESVRRITWSDSGRRLGEGRPVPECMRKPRDEGQGVLRGSAEKGTWASSWGSPWSREELREGFGRWWAVTCWPQLERPYTCERGSVTRGQDRFLFSLPASGRGGGGGSGSFGLFWLS